MADSSHKLLIMPQESFDAARARLNDWRNSKSANYYTDDTHLHHALQYWLTERIEEPWYQQLEQTGKDVAGILNDYACETNRDENLPKIRKFDGDGNKIEHIDFHPLYHEMGKIMYGSGMMSLYEQPGLDVYQMVLYYLFAQNGEAGHCCPLACTAGAIKLLQQKGDRQLKDRFLPKLYDADYNSHYHASQFLTELQGGSDVGAVKTRAIQDNYGQWRIYGEKWFCSVIDAQLWVMAARPEGAEGGTKGLMTFLAPRYLEDGSPNHFEIKRLKYKLGTRSMASAEIDLNGLLAFPVGGPGEGFKAIVEWVLNTSRYYNSFMAAAITKRAYREAASYAKHREAFGAPIGRYPLVKRSLTFLKTEAAMQLSGSMQVAFLAGKIAKEKAHEDERKEFRFLVNAIKYWTSVQCTRASREAIEVLGGNGTIEEFSVLPRLYRDAIVVESWEGTHNVLCQQILRDMMRYQVHEPVLASDLEVCQTENTEIAGKYREIFHTLRDQADELMKMSAYDASLHVRTWLDLFMQSHMGMNLLREARGCRDEELKQFYKECMEYQYLRFLSGAHLFGNKRLAQLEEKLGA